MVKCDGPVNVFDTKAQTVRCILAEPVAQTPFKRCSCIRSSSCAQTGSAQTIVTSPCRSETGWVTAATRSPTTSSQTDCTAARRVLGAACRSAARSASACGARDAAVAHAAAERTTSKGIRTRRSRAAAGTDSSAAAVIRVWPPRSEAADQTVATRRVELTHHVVEQEQWGDPVRGEQRLALGEEQSQESGALLALGAVAAQGSVPGGNLELIQMRPPRSCGRAGGPRRGARSGRRVSPRPSPTRAARTRPCAPPASPRSSAASAKGGASSATASARAAIRAAPASARAASQMSRSPPECPPARRASSALRCARAWP